MKTKNMNKLLDVVVLILPALFLAIGMFLVLSGMNTYRGIVVKTEGNVNERLINNYIPTAVMSTEGSLRVEEDSVIFNVNYDGEDYEKRIYCYENSIRELLTPVGEEFVPEYGEEIFEAQSIKAKLSGKLLTVSISVDGVEHVNRVALFGRGDTLE